MTVFAHAPFLDCGLTTVDFGSNHMSKIQKYEGIRAWQKVRELTKGIVNPSCFDQLYSRLTKLAGALLVLWLT